jgi:hypothetical protein
MAKVDYSYTPGRREKLRYGAVAPKTRELLERAVELANASLVGNKKISKVVIGSGGQPYGGKIINPKTKARAPLPGMEAYGGGAGSQVRHVLGGAADVELYDAAGNKITGATQAGLGSLTAFARSAAQLGATGIGYGPGYMGVETIHVGFGPQATWGGMPASMRNAIKFGWANQQPGALSWTPQDAATAQIASLGYKSIEDFQKAVGLPVDGVLGPKTMTMAYVTDTNAQGQKVTSLAGMVSPSGENLPSFADAQLARQTAQGAAQLNTPGISLEARDAAYAARQAAVQGAAARYNATTAQQAVQNAVSAPKRVLTPTVGKGTLPQAQADAILGAASQSRGDPLWHSDLAAMRAGVGIDMRAELARQAAAAQAPAVSASDMARAAGAARKAALAASPAGIAATDARIAQNGLTPDAVRNAASAQDIRAQQARMAASKAMAAQAALSASRPSQTTQGPSASDLARAAGARAAAAAAASRAASTSAPRPSGPSASDMARAAGAAQVAARTVAAPARATTDQLPGKAADDLATARLTSLPSRTITSPKVTSVSSTPKATTDVPASMRSSYPQANAAQKQLQGVTVYSAPKRVLTAPKPAPVAVSKPMPAPKPAFTSPQVAAAASTTPAGPVAGAAARYAGVMAAQAAQPVTPAVTAPKPVVAVPKPPVPQPLAVPAPVAVVPKPLPPPVAIAPAKMTAAAAGSAAARAAAGGTYTTSKGVTVQQSDMIGGRYGEASYGRKQSDGSVTGTTRSGAGYRSSINEKTGRRQHTVNGRTYTTDSKGRASREKVLCTYYKEKGWLPKRIWLQDGKEYKLRPGDQAEVMRLGYHFWAVPTVRFLETQTPAAKVVERILWPLIRAWSFEAAYRVGYLPKGTIGGKIARAILEPSALIIGKLLTFKRRLLYGG